MGDCQGGPVPDSGEKTVTERVEVVRRKTYGDAKGFSVPQLEAQREQIRETLGWADYPAMVEALAPFAALADDCDELRHEPGSTSLHRIAADDLRRARAALGGEVQAGSDRSELDVDPLIEALLRIQSHGALTDNEQSMVDLAREALSTVPRERKQSVVQRMYAVLRKRPVSGPATTSTDGGTN